jgi:uncharacterized protein (TIGR03067 family)
VRPVLLLTTSLALGFAPAPYPKTPRPHHPGTELRAIQGDWLVATYVVHGRYVLNGSTATVSIAGDLFRWKMKNQSPSDFTIRLAAGKPPRLDFRERGTGKLITGIYKLDDGVLTICTTEPHVGRPPKAFEGDQLCYELMVLKRGDR